MDLNYSPEELAFRDEVRGWLGANLPADLREKVSSYEELSKDDLRALAQDPGARRAGSRRDWPKEWGGTGWNVVQRYIFEEECGYAAAPAAAALRPRACARRCCCASAPTRRRSASCRASTTARTSGARAIRSPAPAPTSRR